MQAWLPWGVSASPCGWVPWPEVPTERKGTSTCWRQQPGIKIRLIRWKRKFIQGCTISYQRQTYIIFCLLFPVSFNMWKTNLNTEMKTGLHWVTTSPKANPKTRIWVSSLLRRCSQETQRRNGGEWESDNKKANVSRGGTAVGKKGWDPLRYCVAHISELSHWGVWRLGHLSINSHNSIVGHSWGINFPALPICPSSVTREVNKVDSGRFWCAQELLQWSAHGRGDMDVTQQPLLQRPSQNLA